MLKEYFCANGFLADTTNSYFEAFDMIYEKHFDLWIIDVQIEDGDGFSLLKKLRSMGLETPAIFTTSCVGIGDLEMGYSVGCDDFLKKPFSLRELLIRINSLLKKSLKSSNFYEINEKLKFDLNKKILYENNAMVTLSNKEIKLLSLFLQNKNKLIKTENIIKVLWEYDEQISYLSLRAYIKRLRQILGKDKITNKRGIGYIYENQ